MAASERRRQRVARLMQPQPLSSSPVAASEGETAEAEGETAAQTIAPAEPTAGARAAAREEEKRAAREERAARAGARVAERAAERAAERERAEKTRILLSGERKSLFGQPSTAAVQPTEGTRIYPTEFQLFKQTLTDAEISSLNKKPRNKHYDIIYNTREFTSPPAGFKYIFHAPSKAGGDNFYIYYKFIEPEPIIKGFGTFEGGKKTPKKSSKTKQTKGKRATSKAKRRK